MKSGRQILFRPFRLDTVNERLWRGSEEILLRPKTFAVLQYLVEHAGRFVTREELLASVWPDLHVSATMPRLSVREIREALGDDAKQPRFIETVTRRGYRFIAPVMHYPQHTLSPQSPVLGGGMVGREGELRQLYEWLEKALTGERQIVFVTGEPGIGKTTLVEVFLQRIRAHGDLWVARGQCVEHRGSGEPYLPVLDGLEQLHAKSGGQRLITLLRELAPMWLAHMPSLLDAGEREGLQRQLAGTTQKRMLREIAQVVEALTVERGLVLWLEDLHWSDFSTLALITYLARRQERSRLFVIGTYRPVEALALEHPLREIKQELGLHGHCRELNLGFLTQAEVGQYLVRRFAPAADIPLKGLAEVIHQRTKGNPLFMVKVIEDLVAREVIAQQEGRWRLKNELKELAVAVPVSVREFVEQQFNRISSEERQVLEAASVAGMEFSAAAVATGIKAEANEVEKTCEGLVRRKQFLRSSGMAEWPDGTVASRYGFVHSLYQNVLYERVPAGTRVELHRVIGKREETAYGDRADTIATELAMHFERGRDYDRAIQYLGRAGENAVQRHAYREAIDNLSRGLKLLKALPDSRERSQQELTLQTTLGVALWPAKGGASPELEEAYARARELCRTLGETRRLFPVLWGLFLSYLVRGESRTARELAEQLMELAVSSRDPVLLLEANHAVATILYYLGELGPARQHFERAITLYEAHEHPSLAFFYGGAHPGVACRSHVVHLLWLLGYPDQALEKSCEGLTLAQQLSHPLSLAHALDYAATLHRLRGEVQAVQEQAEILIRLSSEQGFPFWLADGIVLRGWALVARGKVEEGFAQMRQGLAAWRLTRSELNEPYFLGLLAEAYRKMGRVDEALALLVEALATVEKSGSRVYEPELYRLKGELLLESSSETWGLTGRQSSESEKCFRKAIQVARRQRAKSMELRAVMSLSRLLHEQGKKAHVRQMMAEMYGWFTEGFDTADLQEAKALLEELS